MSEVHVTNETFRRWLRAQRPPEWFWGMSELEQEQLALMGDEYVSEVAGHFAEMLGGGAPAAEVAGTEPELTAGLIQQVAQQVAERVSPPRAAPVAPASFAGHGGSRETQLDDRGPQAADDAVESLLDEVFPTREAP